MSYRILEVSQEAETVTTKVRYDFNGKLVEVDIPHFAPQTEDDVIDGIENRMASEQRKLDATAQAAVVVEAVRAMIG